MGQATSMGNEENEIMTVGEVARLFKVPVSWVYEHCRKTTCTHPSGTRDQLPQLDSEPLACAYVFVIPCTDGPVIEALQKLIITLSSQETGTRMPSSQVTESWLEHVAAAEYLGVARSTLYRYSERHEIESRKFCGRLQYRLSSLDEFKTRHVRPARPFHTEGVIIPAAPRSGK
jgi:excisionase family DNA binding protein